VDQYAIRTSSVVGDLAVALPSRCRYGGARKDLIDSFVKPERGRLLKLLKALRTEGTRWSALIASTVIGRSRW